MLPLWSPWEKEEGRCSGERGAAGVQARQRQWPSARCSSFGLLHAKNITNGPQALFRKSWRQLFGIRDSDSYWSAELLCFLTGLPASSPFLDLPPSCVASLCKNHQWSCIAYTLKSDLLSWCSELLMSCFNLSFCPTSRGFPLGTLSAYHLEHYTVPIPLWIGLFLLTVIPWCPFSIGPAPIQP